jgi:protoheme ferro-lyase
MDRAKKLLWYRDRLNLCTILYSLKRWLEKFLFLIIIKMNYSSSLQKQNYDLLQMTLYLCVITNKLSDALTNINKISKQYIHKYQFRYCQDFMHTDGQTEGVYIGFSQVCNHI